MRDHVRILGILNVVLGGLGLLVGLGIMLIFGGVTAGLATVAVTEDPSAAVGASIVGLVGAAVVGLVMLLSLPAVIAGIGLLKFRP